MGSFDLAFLHLLLRVLLRLLDHLPEQLGLIQQFVSLPDPLATGLHVPVSLALDLELFLQLLILVLILLQEALHDL